LCYTCEEGYFNNEGVCEACTSDCRYCDNETCLVCDIDRYLDNSTGLCVADCAYN